MTDTITHDGRAYEFSVDKSTGFATDDVLLKLRKVEDHGKFGLILRVALDDLPTVPAGGSGGYAFVTTDDDLWLQIAQAFLDNCGTDYLVERVNPSSPYPEIRLQVSNGVLYALVGFNDNVPLGNVGEAFVPIQEGN